MNLSDIAIILKSINWGVWVPAIATVVLTILTFIYVRLTKQILDSQTDPCVIVSVIHNNERPFILELVIKNIGRGIAHDITFDFSKPIPNRAFGMSEKEAKIVEVMTDGPLIEGIPALGPGEERHITWGQYGGLMKNVGQETIVVKCKFKKNNKFMKPIECKLDVKSFGSTSANEHPITTISKELKKISDNLGYLARGFYRLKIEVMEKEEFELEDNKEIKEKSND